MGQEKKKGDNDAGRGPGGFDADVAVRLSLVIDRYDLKAEAARIAKTTGEMLNRYIRGTHKLPFRVAASIAHGKGVSLDWLATGKGAMLLSERCPPTGDSDRPEPVDEALLGNVVEGLELFAAAEDLELEPSERAGLVVLLHRMLARRRSEGERQGLPIPPELTDPNHPVSIVDDRDLATIVRLTGRKAVG